MKYLDYTIQSLNVKLSKTEEEEENDHSGNSRQGNTPSSSSFDSLEPPPYAVARPGTTSSSSTSSCVASSVGAMVDDDVEALLGQRERAYERRRELERHVEDAQVKKLTDKTTIHSYCRLKS
jgi:hypothetical protein